MSEPITEMLTCDDCFEGVSVTCYPYDEGDADIESPTCCPPTEAYMEPTECPECGATLEVLNADEIERDAKEAAEDARFDEWREY